MARDTGINDWTVPTDDWVVPELTQDEQTAVRVQAGKGTVQTETPAQAEAFRRRRVSRVPGRLPGMVSGFPNLPAAEAIIGEAGLVGAYPQIAGGITAAGRRLYDALTGRPSPPMGEVYARERDVARASIDQERQALGATSLPSDLVAGAALPVPFAQRMYAAAPAGAGLVRRALTGARNLAATGVAGGTFGGLYGANIATESWEEKARKAREHALLGVLVGPAIHAGISGGAGLVRGAERLLRSRPTPATRERVADWESLGLEAPTSILAGPGTQQITSRLARTPMGGRTRRDVVLGEQRLQTQLGTELPPVDISAAGEMAQAGTRRGLTIARTPDEISAMSPEELARISGVGREGPPSVPGVLRRPAEADVETRAQQYAGAVTTRPVRVEDVPLSPINASRLANAEKRLNVLSSRAEYHAEEERARQVLRGLIRERDSLAAQVQAARDVGMPASEVLGTRGSRIRLTQQLAQAEAAVTAARASLRSLPLVAARRRLAEVQAHIQQVGEEAVRRNVALQAEEHAANVARARIRARVELDSEYQQALQQEQARTASLGLPASRESFATQVAAGERALADRAPKTQQPLLAQSNSAIRTIMTDIGEEARGMGLLPGFKAENVFDANTGEWNAGLQGFLRQLVGPRIVQTLNALSLQFQRGRIGQGVGGTGNILRTFEEVRARTKNPEVLRVLQRLEEAVRQDLERVAGQTAEGTQWLRAVTEFRAVRDRIVRELEEPLQEVLGTTNPAAVIRILTNSARPGGNIRTLDAFLRVAEAKGDRSNAVSLVLQGLRGNSVQEFARNFRALTPEARVILFAGPTRVLGQRLERVARAAESLTKFEGAGRNLRARDLARLENLGLLGGLINPTTLVPTLKLALGAKAADVVLNSQPFRRWLLGQPIFQRNRLQSVAALAAIPAAAVGLDAASWAKARDALVSPAAAAGPVGATRQFDPQPRDGLFSADEGIVRPLPEGQFTGRVDDPTAGNAGFVSPGLVEAAEGLPEQPAPPEETNPIFRFLRGIKDAFLPAAEASVIGPVGARALSKAGRPLAERLIAMAERLAARGVPEEEIVARGTRLAQAEDPLLGALVEVAPGQWGLEISNSSSRVTRPPPGERVVLGEVLSDPELQAAYPQMFRSLPVRHEPNLAESRHIPRELIGEESGEITLGSSRAPRRTILHEAEHEVQSIEDFPRGANVAMFEAGGQLEMQRLPGETAEQAYRRVGGEWFARQAGSRADLPAPMRRRHSLQLPADAVLLRYAATAESRPPWWTPARLERLRELVNVGRSKEEIAAEFKVTPKAIERILERRAAEFDIPHRTRQDRAIFKTSEQEEEFVKLWNAGVRSVDIAKRVGITPEQAAMTGRRRRDELGLTPRQTGRPTEAMMQRVLTGQDRSVADTQYVVRWLFRNGATATEVAKALKVSKQYVYQIINRYNLVPSYATSVMARLAPRRAEITELAAQHLPSKEILARLGETDISHKSLSKWLVQLAIPHRTYGGARPSPFLSNPEVRDAILELVKQQTPLRKGSRMIAYQAVARRFGMSPRVVQMYAKTLGLPRMARGRRHRYEYSTVADSVLDRQAMNMEREFVQLEQQLQKQGLNEDEIAAEINRQKKTNITGDDLRTGMVWWRLGEQRESEFGAGAVEFHPETMGGRDEGFERYLDYED